MPSRAARVSIAPRLSLRRGVALSIPKQLRRHANFCTFELGTSARLPCPRKMPVPARARLPPSGVMQGTYDLSQSEQHSWP
eukprot:scaffold121408_cov30-Tisochrysis_lutea.AAC.8